jgi:hypothetical protein
VAAAVVGLTSGCTVEARGVMGIGVGADGDPVAFLQVCSDHIDGATAYVTDSDHRGSWTADPAATGFATWSLLDGGDGWSVAEPFVAPEPGQVYSLYGWTRDNSSSATSVSFTAADLAGMKPGQVRYNDVTVVTTVEEFRQHACDPYR